MNSSLKPIDIKNLPNITIDIINSPIKEIENKNEINYN